MTILDPQEIDPLFIIRTAQGEREVNAYSPEGAAVLANLWTRAGWQQKVSYEATFLGIPVIQLPEDLLVLQELIWRTRPTTIIECGVAHGGGLVFYAAILELIGRGRAIGIDIEIRKYNRQAIESHPMSKRITLIEGSSTDPATLRHLQTLLRPNDEVMVMLDSNHSRDHVRAELEMYSSLVSPGGYIVVFDSVMNLVHDAPNGASAWSSDNPLEAVNAFLGGHSDFEQDRGAERLGATYCSGGFLRRRVET